jgi:hypothetical protein
LTGSAKIGVLTFHRCINYGSYWQARCLVEGLRRQGREAVLLDHQSKRIDRAEWACALRPLLPARAPRPDLALYSAKVRKFFEAFATLPLSAPFSLEDPQDMETRDTVVVGSDEVWNFRHPWYAGCPLFFGDGLKVDRLVAYAASFGNHEAGDGIGGRWAERLEQFADITVRDENSRELIRKELGREPAVVLDPCLQFEELCRPQHADRGFAEKDGVVVVYGHSFSEAFAMAVRSWARTRGLTLISVGYRNAWADEQHLAAGPDEFAAAMAGARAVVTNFFHGCVFALVNRKPFACAVSDYRSHKLTALVNSLGAEARLIAGDPEQAVLENALDLPLEPTICERMAALRRHSQACLDHALD